MKIYIVLSKACFKMKTYCMWHIFQKVLLFRLVTIFEIDITGKGKKDPMGLIHNNLVITGLHFSNKKKKQEEAKTTY